MEKKHEGIRTLENDFSGGGAMGVRMTHAPTRSNQWGKTNKQNPSAYEVARLLVKFGVAAARTALSTRRRRNRKWKPYVPPEHNVEEPNAADRTCPRVRTRAYRQSERVSKKTTGNHPTNKKKIPQKRSLCWFVLFDK